MKAMGFRYWQKNFKGFSFEFEFNIREVSIGLFYDFWRCDFATIGIKIPFLTVSFSWYMMK